jgi:hypothetical protein
MGTIKSENCNLATIATIEPGNRRRLMLLQTFSTRGFDELAGAFPRWDLRFRQFGRGSFRGRRQFLDLRGIQVFRVAVNRIIHIEGCPPPGSFGCFPVLAANENALWNGRRLKAGQVRVFDPGQEADHVTAPDNYQLVALAVDGDLFRQEVPVLGEFELEERLVGKVEKSGEMTEFIGLLPVNCRVYFIGNTQRGKPCKPSTCEFPATNRTPEARNPI